MGVHCTNQSCGPASRLIRYGFFRRLEDGRRIQRFRCRRCGRTCSSSTFRPAYRQHRRRLNPEIERLLVAKMNLAQIARHVGANPKTIARKLCYLGELRLAELDAFVPSERYRHVQFDEMQSSEHTKCKPLSIPVAVDARTYRILAFDVCSMPAQHPLVEISLRKYGPRRDDRPEAIARVIRRIAPMVKRGGLITTDMAPRYPAPIMRHVPHVSHVAVRSRKARAVGQGELKRIGFDPLFPLNHTAAMIRDGVSRLVRKTWANTKRPDRLNLHLAVYAHYYNTVILARRTRLPSAA